MMHPFAISGNSRACGSTVDLLWLILLKEFRVTFPEAARFLQSKGFIIP